MELLTSALFATSFYETFSYFEVMIDLILEFLLLILFVLQPLKFYRFKLLVVNPPSKVIYFNYLIIIILKRALFNNDNFSKNHLRVDQLL
jgi:hypothetical protein